MPVKILDFGIAKLRGVDGRDVVLRWSADGKHCSSQVRTDIANGLADRSRILSDLFVADGLR